MNRFVAFFILFFLSQYSFAQINLQVVHAESHQPIAGAEVSCNNKVIGKTNAQGLLNFKTHCKKIQVKSQGFYDEESIVENNMKVLLTVADPKMKAIEMVTIADKSDPKAIALLKKVNDHYENNAPKSLSTYSYKSYEKISFDFDQDSIAAFKDYTNHRIDSLKNVKPKKLLKTKKKKDSLEEIRMLHLMQDSKLFVWERAMEFLWSKKKGEKTIVLDNRVSGLHQPLYEMMALRSNRNKIPRELVEENRKLYRFFLTDSTEIEGRKTYVIRFRPSSYKNKNKPRKFTGLIFVDAATYAVKKIEHNSKVKNEGYIESVWTPYQNKWFLKSEKLKFRVGNTVFHDVKKSDTIISGDKNIAKSPQEVLRKKFGNYIYMKSDYFDYKSPIENRDKDFEGYYMEVKNSDGKLLDQYRTDSLTSREKLTYEKIDSIGKKYKIDQKLGVVTGMLRGKLRLGMFNIDVPKILKFNRYEGFRTTLAVKLNERFHSYISPDFYVAYGFKDHHWKYGVGVDVRTSLKRNAFFRLEYFDDVTASGKFNEYLWNPRMKLMNSEVDLNNDKFFHYKGMKLAYEYDLTNGLTLNTALKRQTEKALFDYQFDTSGNYFNNFSTYITLKYSPNAKNIMTPSGKFTFEENYPDFIFNYEQGLSLFGGELSYSRWDLLAVHHFKTRLGVSGFRLYGGITQGKTPIWHHFAMSGLGNGKDQLNYNLSSYLGFATMQGGKYFNDRFVGTYLTHRIPWYFSTFGKNISSFDFVYRGVIGDMKNPEIHHFDFQKLNHLYQEVGLEWNNFLSSQFNIGFFYRVGHYATNKFNDNFAIQFKFKLLGF